MGEAGIEVGDVAGEDDIPEGMECFAFGNDEDGPGEPEEGAYPAAGYEFLKCGSGRSEDDGVGGDGLAELLYLGEYVADSDRYMNGHFIDGICLEVGLHLFEIDFRRVEHDPIDVFRHDQIGRCEGVFDDVDEV